MPKTVSNQAQKFKQAARELGVKLDEAKLKEALRKIAPEKPAPRPERTRKSD
jgi:hypothetical protein